MADTAPTPTPPASPTNVAPTTSVEKEFTQPKPDPNEKTPEVKKVDPTTVITSLTDPIADAPRPEVRVTKTAYSGGKADEEASKRKTTVSTAAAASSPSHPPNSENAQPAVGTPGTAPSAGAQIVSRPTFPAANNTTAVSPTVIPTSAGVTNANLTINFTHIPTSRTVSFTAFLESFNDSFDAEWSNEKVFGRMDPIVQYKGTSRKINCSFTIPAESIEEAYFIHSKISTLLNMMYPAYTVDGGLQVYNISAPPLMLIKFNNLIRSSDDKSRGLLGYIPSLKYEPNMDSNIFTFNGNDTFLNNFQRNFERYKSKLSDPAEVTSARMRADPERIAWQSLKLSFELNVLHTHRLGYVVNSDPTTNIAGTSQKSLAPATSAVSDDSERFPYGYKILRS